MLSPNYVSHVYIYIFFFFFWKRGSARWWRVCYQRGLPRLVSSRHAIYVLIFIVSILGVYIEALQPGCMPPCTFPLSWAEIWPNNHEHKSCFSSVWLDWTWRRKVLRQRKTIGFFFPWDAVKLKRSTKKKTKMFYIFCLWKCLDHS